MVAGYSSTAHFLIAAALSRHGDWFAPRSCSL